MDDKWSELKLRPGNCKFGAEETPFLGHVLTSSGVKMDLGKTGVVREFPVPRNAEIFRFHGLARYYRKFVYTFVTITLLLYKLVRRQEPFIWTYECQRTPDLLKENLRGPFTSIFGF